MRPVLPVVLVCAVALGVVGCAPDDHLLPTPTTTSPVPSLPSTPEPPDPNEGVSGGKIDLLCNQLVSDDVIYEWGNGNFAIDSTFAAPAGSLAADAVAEGGLACGWVNLSSGETVSVAVADLGDDALATAKADAAARSTPTTAYGADGFFSFDGSAGHVDVFSGNYWLTAESTWFYQQGDAAPLVSAAIDALP